jgi:antitoxin ParD1/3/4
LLVAMLMLSLGMRSSGKRRAFGFMGMNVNLTLHLEELVRQKVESGLYTSASEVVREALRLMDEKDRLAPGQARPNFEMTSTRAWKAGLPSRGTPIRSARGTRRRASKSRESKA